MNVVFNDKSVIRLDIKKENIIYPWGFEAGDSYSFYTLTSKPFNATAKRIGKNTIKVNMVEAEYDLQINEKVQKNTIKRTHTLNITKNSAFQDVVTRYRFKKKYFDYALIDGKKILHKEKNIYYQYPVSEAKLIGKEFDIQITIDKTIVPENTFIPNIYVRDYKDEWIIHVRLIPYEWNKEIIKWCKPWYNKAIPQWITNKILKYNCLRNFLWYRGERIPYRFPFSILAFNAYGISYINKGEKIILSSLCKVILHKN